jgi:iron complex transport system permease protein
VLLAALVGGGLGLVGAALQSLFRNPMADSGLLGVGPGAALGAVIAIEVGLQDVAFGLPLAAFVGALLSVVLVYVLSHVGGRPTLQGLLLTGLAVAALASAATSVLLVSAQEFRVRAILFWLSEASRAAGGSTLGSAPPSSSRARAPSSWSRAPSTCSRWATKRPPP